MIFSWGYWGWGTTTAEFVRAADAVEASRGYAPPLFVDIRIARDVRAIEFRGTAFESLVTPERYRRMPSLGNRLASDRHGRVEIADPSKAGELLDVALECERRAQRVLFFCACLFPGIEGRHRACHRTTVARLVHEEAQRRGTSTAITEWPGGKPTLNGLDVTVATHVFKKLNSGRKSIPLGALEPARLAHMASVPWGSIVSVHCDQDAQEPLRIVTAAARYRAKDGWFLPVLQTLSASSIDSVPLVAAEWRRAKGIVDQVPHF